MSSLKSVSEVENHPKIIYLRELERQVYRLEMGVFNRLHNEHGIAPLLEQLRVRVTSLRMLNATELASGHRIEPQSILDDGMKPPSDGSWREA